MTRHLLLTEGAPARPEPLRADEAWALDALELATVTRSPGAAGWLVGAGTKVGTVRVGDLQVTVRPKIEVARLLFLLGYAGNPRHWRDHTVLLDPDTDLVEALALAFASQARRALQLGVLHGYRTVGEPLAVLRGRVLVGEQLARRPGRMLPLEVEYDDFGVDIAENRLLLAATLRLLATPGVDQQVRRTLQRIRLQLADVTPLRRRSPLPAWIPTRLNTRYHPALRLAELVLRGDSFDQRVGDLAVTGFVVDMWRVFEEFVTRALSDALGPHGGVSSCQYRMHLDERRVVPMRPDFVWHAAGGAPVVVDAKYKAQKPTGFPQADLYQLLAYCTVLGIDEGHLIYARGEEEPARHHVLGSGTRIECHTLDLGARPADLLAQVSHLAGLLVAGRHLRPTRRPTTHPDALGRMTPEGTPVETAHRADMRHR